MSLPRLVCELGWWYKRPAEEFLKMPFRQFWRHANEMYRLNAKQELLTASGVTVGHFGKKETWRELQDRASGKRVKRLSKQETQKAMNGVNNFLELLARRREASKRS